MPDLTPSVLFNRILGRVRLKHLQLAIAIADLQSLHRAASSIGLSQPAATHALVELESSLGGPLFERHSKGMRLTRLGEAILPLLRASLVPLQAVAGNAALMQQGAGSALIRIGSIAAGINGLLAAAIPAYFAKHPDAAIDVHEVTIDNLLESIQEGTLDLAICREPAPLPQGFEFRAALRDEFVVACRPRHPLARQAAVTAAELLAQRWLAPPLTGLGPQQVENLFDDLGGVPELCRVSSRSTEIIYAMLTESDMLVCAPASLLRPLVQRKELAVLSWRPQGVGPLGVLVKTDVLANPAHSCHAFIEHVLSLSA
ncbi:DNA-binding transcriptional LysR family regulator [Acidovorax sp. 107]|uniref:LysR family transcriptional regulator n=1 Tax=Acidovorax sp. 107 TaxID=2135638 RepID=UPI000D39C826|nr:LysR family transcriptional regulator [Acidovorax sp. 107]PUA98311.1 DNA-binding transcriptional LysR family regulator [Acidovorax sp. 107]